MKTCPINYDCANCEKFCNNEVFELFKKNTFNGDLITTDIKEFLEKFSKEFLLNYKR